MGKIIIYLIISISVASGLSSAYPAEIDGISFSDEYPAGGKKLFVRGPAVLYYLLAIKAYAGALYLPAGAGPASALSEGPRILELHYFQKISAEDFRHSTVEMIKKNSTPAEFDSMKDQVDTFNGLYRNVNPGDRYRAEYIPGKGTTLYMNGRALGTVKGGEFSRAFFSIWIGANPIDKKFRDTLLGRK